MNEDLRKYSFPDNEVTGTPLMFGIDNFGWSISYAYATRKASKRLKCPTRRCLNIYSGIEDIHTLRTLHGIYHLRCRMSWACLKIVLNNVCQSQSNLGHIFSALTRTT